MKKLLIYSMISACLITTFAQAQTYNATGSERQAASNDMGMYQLTLEAFRKSDYYLNPQSGQANNVRWAFDTVILAKGFPAIVRPTGQIIEYMVSSEERVTNWVEADRSRVGPGAGIITYETAGQSLFTVVSTIPTNMSKGNQEILNTSTLALNTFVNLSNTQRSIFLTLADIAEKSFSVIRNKKLNRSAAVSYLSKQIDANFSVLVAGNFKAINNIVMTSGVPGQINGISMPTCVNPIDSKRIYCTNKYGSFLHLTEAKLVPDGFYEWTAIFPGGLVIKNNYGSVDVSQNGRPWFSESGIKGEKLSIAGSSDKGSSTSQKRGE
jgi:hypothetical protein